MAKIGDRVVVEGSKVGGGRREGTLTQVVGSLIRVRWNEGGETLMAPAAGAIQFLPGNSKSSGATEKKAAAKKAPAKKKK
jgi:uncharacterized protein DUF1918